MPDYLNEIFLSAAKEVVGDLQKQGLTPNEIEVKIGRNAEKALETVVDKASDTLVDYMKAHVFEIYMGWEACDAEFLARQDQKWGECFAASRLLYSSSIEAVKEFSTYVNDESKTKDFSPLQYTYLSLHHLHGRACQVFLEILTLMRGGLADGAYARCRTLYEICCIANFIKEKGEPIAKEFYKQSNSDISVKSYKWANSVIDEKGKKVNSFGQIQKMCNMAKQWVDGYDLACLISHASPQGTFGRIANAKNIDLIPAGRCDYGIKQPGVLSALCLQWITAVFLTLFFHTDSMSSAMAISKWAEITCDKYSTTHDKVFQAIIEEGKADEGFSERQDEFSGMES